MHSLMRSLPTPPVRMKGSTGWVVGSVLTLAAAAFAGPSDFLRYEIDVGGTRNVLRLHAHDLTSEGYRPVTPAWTDVGAIVALSPPPAGKAEGKFERRIEVRDMGDLRLSCTYSVTGFDATMRYTFASRPAKTSTLKVSDGTASVTLTLDEKRRVVEAKMQLRCTLEKPDGEEQVKEERTFKLDHERKHGAPGFQKDVDAAIDKGVAYLKGQQRDDGTYPPHREWSYGTTALCAFTLVSCGVARSDPTVEKTLAWMVARTPNSNYERAIALMTLDRAYAPPGELARAHRGQVKEFKRDLPPDRLAWCRQVAAAIEKHATRPGSWGYGQPGGSKRVDSSNTQYAVLGLRAAAHLGISADERTWLGVLKHFRGLREKRTLKGDIRLLREGEAVAEGKSVAGRPVRRGTGFRYRGDHEFATGSMTTAAIASLLIARHELARLRSPRAKSLRKEIDAAVLGAWLWLDRYWSMSRVPGRVPAHRWLYYYLYSVERAAVLDRVKRVGGRDWYFEGAALLLDTQHKSGAWGRQGVDPTNTCFALLFLKRATAPLTVTR
jgi:hypothetical protein